jgi:tRNA-dihydrouridine synthase B
MRAGWNESSRNAPELARMVEDAGAAAVTIHGRTAEQSYKGLADWELVERVASRLEIPVLGSGECVEPHQVVERMKGSVSGVLVGRGVLRNPWILAQASDIAAGLPPRSIPLRERGGFLLEYVELLLTQGHNEREGFRHVAPGASRLAEPAGRSRPASGRERWVINKIRALGSWYSKGFEGGSQFRVRINACESIAELRDIITEFFLTPVDAVPQSLHTVAS